MIADAYPLAIDGDQSVYAVVINAGATPILPTRNTEWGFFGTLRHHADEAWPLAMAAIAKATGRDGEAVRDFLDSVHGRHFADDVANELHRGLDLAAAIDAAVARWMGWIIDRRTARETGIPEGLPYLTGFVTQAGIEAELAE